ncbi:MAG: response regulator, partial [Spirochaetaceae bacterium]|nr:response regulator [Spirochaetaceae bacterium]MCF7952409.1 response regulator [Spirochaetaceae bacterium]
MHVLIADDSSLIRKNLIKLIKPIEGVTHISEAEDISPTVKILNTTLPEVLILDLQMPEGNGLEVLSYIQEKHLKVKVIVLTNYVTEYYREKSMELGAEYFYDKSNEFHKV